MIGKQCGNKICQQGNFAETVSLYGIIFDKDYQLFYGPTFRGTGGTQHSSPSFNMQCKNIYLNL